MLYKGKSKIEGWGLFTDEKILKGEYIGTFKLAKAKYVTKFSIAKDGKWYRAICILKHSNHSTRPNAEVDEDLNMWALKTIKPAGDRDWETL